MASHSQFLREYAGGEQLDPSSRVTRIRQSVDDLQVLIESARSTLNSPANSRVHGSHHANNYHIHIDDKQGHSSLDFNISFDPRSPTGSIAHNSQSRYRSENWAKQQLEATRYQTTRVDDFEQPSPSFERQEKSFARLSKTHSRVTNFRSPPSDPPIIRPQIMQPSPQVYNYAADDSIHSEEYHLTPPHSPLQPLPREDINLISLEKHAEQMIEEPPSMPNIPARAEPIVVPISSIPQNTLNHTTWTSPYHRSIKFTSSRSKSPQTVKVNLNETMKAKKQRENDRFLLQKSRYLNRLKQEESRLSKSRTLSKSKRPLSASCQQITDRLHYSKTNEQPCPKYQHYLGVLKRMKMKETVSDYTFIRRYLSDREICEIFQELQKQKVPEHKWPMKVVDVVYSRMHKWRSY